MFTPMLCGGGYAHLLDEETEAQKCSAALQSQTTNDQKSRSVYDDFPALTSVVGGERVLCLGGGVTHPALGEGMTPLPWESNY